MPTYEYACRDCGEHLEVVQSFKDDPLTECGRCGGPLRKVFSAAGIIFKGSGYYVTDSRAAGGSGDGDSTTGSKDTSKDAPKTAETPKAQEKPKTTGSSDDTAKSA